MWRRASSKIHKNDQIGVQMTVESSDDDVDDHHDVEYKLTTLLMPFANNSLIR
jgi:hypothetical protein